MSRRIGLRKTGVDPFDEGARAFDAGLPRWTNPWLDHPDFRPRWFGGYDAALNTHSKAPESMHDGGDVHSAALERGEP